MKRIDPIEWRVWWLAEEPVKGVILVLVILLVPLFLYGAMPESPGLAIIGFLILFGSFRELLVPIVYRLTRESIRWRTLFLSGTKPLHDIKRIQEGPTGFWLSPMARDSLLDDFRGFWLRVPRKDSRIREQVQHRLQLLFKAVQDD